MDRGTWPATVHGVAKRQTQPSNTHRPTVSLYSVLSKSIPEAGLGNTCGWEKWGSAGRQRGRCAPIDTHCTIAKHKDSQVGTLDRGGDLSRQGTGVQGGSQMSEEAWRAGIRLGKDEKAPSLGGWV